MNEEIQKLHSLKAMLDIEAKIIALVAILVNKGLTTTDEFKTLFKEAKESESLGLAEKYKRIDDQIEELKKLEDDPISAFFNMMKGSQ